MREAKPDTTSQNARRIFRFLTSVRNSGLTIPSRRKRGNTINPSNLIVKRNNTTCRYRIDLKAYAEADQSKLSISVRSTSGYKALELGFKDGLYNLLSGSGAETLAGTYTPGTVHAIRIDMNMDTQKFSVTINGVMVAVNKSFLDAGFKDLKLLRFEYIAAILEAFPGVYVVDDVVIKAIIL